MKTSIILAVLITMICLGCANQSQSNNIAGTYINEAKSDYSIAYDTLTITPLDHAENNYQIERKTGYQKIRNAILQSKEYKVEKWQSSWDNQKQVLSETEYGRQITRNKDGKSLTLKNTEYIRIK